MKLLFLSNLFPDESAPYLGLDNATLLAQLAARHEVRVFAPRPVLPWQPRAWRARPQDAGFEPQFVPALYVPKIGSRWNHRLMARALRAPLRTLRARFPFDVVLASWLFPDCCAVADLACEERFPFLAIAQGSDAHQYLREAARRRVMLERLPRAAAIITRSAALAQLLAEAGLPRERLHAIYNGIDFAQFAPGNRAEARRALGLPVDGRSILFVGNFYAIKNPLLAVEAHARLRAADCRLVMIGAGPLVEETLARTMQLGTADRVIFAGRQDAAGVARHLQAADALCLPSWNEGVPNVVLEAFACGLPVVASRVGGLPEVHTGEFLGRLVPPGDAEALAAALDAVLQTPPPRAPILAHAQQFSWERTAAAYEALLQRTAR